MTLSPGLATVIMAAIMASVLPQVVTISVLGSICRPIRRDCFSASSFAEVLRAPGDGILVEVFMRYFGQAVQNRRRRVEIRVTLGKIDGTVLSADAGHAADNGIGKMFRAGG